MAAVLIAASAPGLAHQMLLPASPDGAASALQNVRLALGHRPPHGLVVLHSGSWQLDLPQLRELQRLFHTHGLKLCRVEGHCEETLVAAAAIGLPVISSRAAQDEASATGAGDSQASGILEGLPGRDGLNLHRGTLRSGDQMEVGGSLLVLGDVNPGARVRAVGHVLVWGRLRGIAHAGCAGDANARIVAMQLRPLQLRIADAVARGPEDQPPQGFCEQATLVGGTIRIDPAEPFWPVADA
jgi:septum site-determining protein MinC